MIEGKVLLGATVFLTLAATSSTVLAQTSAASAGRDQSLVALDEIVVTAEKRSENLQEIPKQIQVVTSDQLQRSNVSSLNDLVKLVPSLSGTNNATNTSIRGVATAATTISANSKVGTVLDDIPIPSRASAVRNLLDISQVEVLPGPQGTLAGRNATGGLINLVTRKPSRTGIEGIFQAMATTDHENVLGAYLSGPLSDQFAFSLSANYQYQRGLKYNVRTGQWDVATNNFGTRAKLLWTLTENSELTATYSYFSDETRGNANRLAFSYIGVPLTSISSTLDLQTPKRTFTELFPGVTPGPDNRGFYTLFGDRQQRVNNTGVLRYELSLPTGTFTAIGSIMKESAPQLQDTNTYTLVNMNIRPEYDGYAHVFNYTDYKTFEARFASPTDQNWTYLVGTFLSDNVNQYHYARYYQPVNWNRWFGQSNGALFGSTSYRFPTGTTVRGGVRYEKDKIDYKWIFNPILATTRLMENGTTVSFPVQNQYRLSQSNASDSFVNFDLGLQQTLGDDAMVYLTYARANQGPIYDAEDNTVAVVRDLTPVPAEQVSSIEVGLKSQWLDHRLTVNVNLFDSTFDNYQASTNVPDPNNPLSVPVLKLWPLGKVISRGVELTSSALLGDKFRLDVAGMYNDAHIDSWKNAPCYPQQSAFYGCVVGIPPGENVSRSYQPDLSGKPLASAPKYKLTTTGTYSDSLGFLPVDYKAALTVRYASKQVTNLLQDPASNLPATTYVDGNLAFSKNNVEVSLFVNNLFNEFAETFTTQMAPGITNFPRTNNGDWPVKARVLDRNNFRYFGLRLRASF